MNCFYVIYKEEWGPAGWGCVACQKRTAISVCLDRQRAIEKVNGLMDQAYKQGLDEDKIRYTYEELEEVAFKDGQLVFSLNEK